VTISRKIHEQRFYENLFCGSLVDICVEMDTAVNRHSKGIKPCLQMAPKGTPKPSS